MNWKQFWVIALLILAVIFISGCLQPTLPPGLSIFCHINKDFLFQNNLLDIDTKNPLFYYYYTKENTTISLFVDVDVEEYGFLIFHPPYYDDNLVNETKFYLINNFCIEDIKPVLDFIKQKGDSLEKYGVCDVWNSKHYSCKYKEEINDWFLCCN